MQTQKARNGSADVPKKLSPFAARLLKLAALEICSSSSPISVNNRTPKDKSPKVPDRRSPRSPVSEEGDLEFGAISSDEREGLAVVVQEIRQLKLQIEMVASSEAGHVKQAELRNSEIHLLRGNLMDTLFFVDNFRNQLKDCEVTESEMKALATETLKQLENAKKAVEELKSDGTKALESYRKMAVELEQSKSRMVWLEGLVTKLLANPVILENHETLRKDYARLKADLMDKETQLQIVSDENETLKSDIHKRETDVQDALMKLGIAMEEADKNSQRAVRVTEQLEATQASKSEMETELRKLKVQSNQWEKNAEEATAMLSATNNNNQTNSSYSEDINDEVQRRKRGMRLRRLVFC